MIKATNKPSTDHIRSTKQIRIQFDRPNKSKDKQKLPPLPKNSLVKKQSSDSVPEDSPALTRDRSGTKLFKLKQSDSQGKIVRSHSLKSDKRGEIQRFVTNHRIKILSKEGESVPENPERVSSSSMISSNITFTFKFNRESSQKHLEYRSPAGKYMNKIKTTKLEFSNQKEKSLVSTEGSSVEVLKVGKEKGDGNGKEKQSTESPGLVFKRKQSIGMKPQLSDFIKGRRLGKGYFGEVFMIQHKQLGFICAMKTISRELIRKERVEDQIIRELKISLYVSHPNIIQTYGYFFDTDNLYILQELMTEDELYKIMKRKRVLSEEQAANVVSQVLEALSYLHANHITHRDIKPENILLERGVAKLCDFGWAVHDPSDYRTSYIGTLLYLSPENIKGDGYDRRNDIWAVGVLTYEMLIGNVPFTIWSQRQRHKIISQQVRFPSYIPTSEQAQNFILQMLEKNPSNRASLSELQSHQFLKKYANSQDHVSFL